MKEVNNQPGKALTTGKESIRVLQINTYDTVGGAGRVGFRLHKSYNSMSPSSSRLWVRRKFSKDTSVHSSMLADVVQHVIGRLDHHLSTQYLLYPAAFVLPFLRIFRAADVVHLHNIHGDYFNPLALLLIARLKPVVWTLHDQWAFTGHCAHTYDCQRWQIGCGDCPYLGTYPALSHDYTHLHWRLKSWIYHRSSLTLVSPSLWLAQRVKDSMLSHHPLHVIPNGVDTTLYQPVDEKAARAALGLPVEQPTICIAAEHLGIEFKGFPFLLEALSMLDSPQRTRLLAIGDSSSLPPALSERFDVTAVGRVSDERLMAICYAASDVFVLPSVAENAPLVTLEAMSCGTPVVAFDVGGVSEQVSPPLAGLVASLRDSAGLAEAISTVLSSPAMQNRMGVNARRRVVEEYSLELQASRYQELYRDVVLPGK